MRMGRLITLAVFAICAIYASGCDKQSNRSSVTSFKEIHAREINVKNPCVNGYAYCAKLKKCIRPFGLVKDGRVADMEERFRETCSVSNDGMVIK